MKKARDYADSFKADPTDKALVVIAQEFVREIEELAKARHVSSNEAMFSIFDEQDRKWKAFARLVGGDIIRPDGFEELMKAHFPEVHLYWRGPARDVARPHIGRRQR